MLKSKTYNDDNKVLLSEESKRVTKSKINETFKMFTDNRKSFDFWRLHSEQLSVQLNLKLPIRRRAKELLENCFDYFKDIRQVEYRKIYRLYYLTISEALVSEVAEQFIIPEIAKKIYEINLVENNISVIPIHSRYFDPFLKRV